MKLILITLVAVVVGLTVACTATAPNIDATVEAAIYATKTAEAARPSAPAMSSEPNLTYEMMEGILSQYWKDYY